MSNKYSEELELIMSMYRSGKITGEQKDELIAALEKRGDKKKERDYKKIVFRVITETRKTDPAEIVRILSAVSGVDKVTFDERNSLATVTGDFDVDGIIAAARAGEVRLRVRDIDINYEPEQKAETDGVRSAVDDEISTENFDCVPPEQSEGSVCDGEREVCPSDREEFAEIFVDDEDVGFDDDDIDDDEECDDEDDEEDEDDDDDFDFDDEDDETEEEDEQDDDDDEEDEEDEDDGNFDEDDEIKINIDDSRSLSEFLKGLGAKISDAFDKGIKASDAASKKFVDFADNTVIKMCDLGKGHTIIKSSPEHYDAPYSQMTARIKIVTDSAVKVFSGEPENVKLESERHLPEEMFSALSALIDSQFTGRYKYVGNDAVFKLSVKPKDDD